MNKPVPEFIKNCVTQAGERLGLALDELDWPSDKDAAPSEINALIGVQNCLSRYDDRFRFYSEGTVSERGRIDLMGFNGDVAIAMEAKRLDSVSGSMGAVCSDLARLKGFSPKYYKGVNPYQQGWWQEATERWGIVLITSFLRENVVREAWEAGSAEEARAILSKRYRSIEPCITLISDPALQRFSVPIPLPDRWTTHTAPGWILCGAIELDANPTPDQSQL